MNGCRGLQTKPGPVPFVVMIDLSANKAKKYVIKDRTIVDGMDEGQTLPVYLMRLVLPGGTFRNFNDLIIYNETSFDVHNLLISNCVTLTLATHLRFGERFSLNCDDRPVIFPTLREGRE